MKRILLTVGWTAAIFVLAPLLLLLMPFLLIGSVVWELTGEVK